MINYLKYLIIFKRNRIPSFLFTVALLLGFLWFTYYLIMSDFDHIAIHNLNCKVNRIQENYLVKIKNKQEAYKDSLIIVALKEQINFYKTFKK